MPGGPTQGDRDLVGTADWLFAFAVEFQQRVAIEHECRTAGRDMHLHYLVVRGQAEPDEFAVIASGLVDEPGIFRIQYELPGFPDGVAQDPLDIEQLVEVTRAEIAEMVLADIGDQRRVGALDAEPAAQEPAARGFENRCVDFALA